MENWSGVAKTALACVAIWVVGLAWMWIDYQRPQVWDISAGPIIMMLAMAIAGPVLVVCLVILLWRRMNAQ